MIIDGKAISADLEEQIKAQVQAIEGRKPCLVVIIVGDHAPSQVYVRKKEEACNRCGITSKRIDLPDTTTQEELLSKIDELNQDDTVDGILVQLPLPDAIDPDLIIEAIHPLKDVDGFHPINVGRTLIGSPSALSPCTPAGVHSLLQAANIDVAGKHVVIVGRSNIVGKPLAAILMQKAPGCNATVTVAHSRTRNLKEVCLTADILVAAIGRHATITADMVKQGAVVIDVGTNRVDDPSKKRGYRIAGDVDFESVKEIASAITPVPGGVGPMTIVMLMKNTLTAYNLRNQ